MTDQRCNAPAPLPRRPSRRVAAGGVPIGGGAPITIQSMTNTDTRDAGATLEQIGRLAAAGADLVRVAVPDAGAVAVLRRICAGSEVPIIADIHFDHHLALGAIAAGAAKVRINPGNLEREEYVRAVAAAARAADVPIRVGVNAGSLPQRILRRTGVTPEGMVEAALEQVRTLEEAGFEDLVISLKASNVTATVRANELMSRRSNYPLHLGVTEAGTAPGGTVKSAVGIGYLLGRGIGDTVRVSLTGDPVEEVRAAAGILSAWGLRQLGPEIISCPTCGRCRVDLVRIVNEVGERLEGVRAPVRVAVMGCEVNGPGEAREADVGLACGRGMGLLMREGRVVKKVSEEDMVEELVQLVRQHLASREVE
ncbi:MAG: flavodoxin-dependent (E)-4-hydroxy-3-methylbut-2-enyl-diphosphate synthase [Bacillota bacterium]